MLLQWQCSGPDFRAEGLSATPVPPLTGPCSSAAAPNLHLSTSAPNRPQLEIEEPLQTINTDPSFVSLYYHLCFTSSPLHTKHLNGLKSSSTIEHMIPIITQISSFCSTAIELVPLDCSTHSTILTRSRASTDIFPVGAK